MGQRRLHRRGQGCGSVLRIRAPAGAAWGAFVSRAHIPANAILHHGRDQVAAASGPASQDLPSFTLHDGEPNRDAGMKGAQCRLPAATGATERSSAVSLVASSSADSDDDDGVGSKNVTFSRGRRGKRAMSTVPDTAAQTMRACGTA